MFFWRGFPGLIGSAWQASYFDHCGGRGAWISVRMGNSLDQYEALQLAERLVEQRLLLLLVQVGITDGG